MSTLSTITKRVSSYLYFAGWFVAFVVLTLTAQKAKADDVLIFFNSDTKRTISRHDGALITHNAEVLAKEIKKLNPELNIRLEPVPSIRDASYLLAQVKEKVRGVVFIGHGNSQVFALNTSNQASGAQMSYALEYLPRDKIAEKLTVYFLGCEMGRPDKHKINFQEQFYENYMRNFTNSATRPVVDVIAHTSMSAHKSFKEPNAIEAYSYKSGVGRWAENITLKRGYVIPNLNFLIATSGAGYLAGLDHSSVTAVGAAALAAIFAKAYAEGGISKYGLQMSGTTKTQNSIASLLRTSFQADQCQAIFKLKSL